MKIKILSHGSSRLNVKASWSDSITELFTLLESGLRIISARELGVGKSVIPGLYT